MLGLKINQELDGTLDMIGIVLGGTGKEFSFPHFSTGLDHVCATPAVHLNTVT